LKRSMFGRANLDLLRRRILLPNRPEPHPPLPLPGKWARSCRCQRMRQANAPKGLPRVAAVQCQRCQPDPAQRGVSWHALAVHIGPAAATQRLAAYASGMRSPLAPTEPNRGMAGTNVVSSMAARPSTTCGETPEHPWASDHTVVQAGLKESAAPVRPIAHFRRDIDGDWRGRPPQISWPQRRRQADDGGVRGRDRLADHASTLDVKSQRALKSRL
jgi:hypothetical protein